HAVARAGGPGEVMDIVAVVRERLSTVGVLDLFHPHTARTHYFVLRQSQADVIHAEISEELGGCVILVAIPGAVPPHAHFREPLSAEDEVTVPTTASLRLGKFVVKPDLEL